MSKAVLISIRPQWCELIASGEKTIEVRKSRPKIEPPFKCYIYCTKSSSAEKLLFLDFYGGTPKPGWVFPINRDTALRMGMAPMNGMVIGEFVCDAIYPVSFYASDSSFFDTEPPLSVPGTCLTDRDIAEYLGNGKTGYGWNISEMKIYDKPKKLGEFKRHDPTYDFSIFGEVSRTYSINRPPQSWCYVETLEDQ